ncbi:hypothetical protein FQA39_LY04045 [Lamprigera yunnana]|nr:hypothetical protein FQA39_LY04045 [Lamprigera yunnana]
MATVSNKVELLSSKSLCQARNWDQRRQEWKLENMLNAIHTVRHEEEQAATKVTVFDVQSSATKNKNFERKNNKRSTVKETVDTSNRQTFLLSQAQKSQETEVGNHFQPWTNEINKPSRTIKKKIAAASNETSKNQARASITPNSSTEQRYVRKEKKRLSKPLFPFQNLNRKREKKQSSSDEEEHRCLSSGSSNQSESVGEQVPGEDKTECLFYVENFNTSQSGEVWIQCVICKK